MANCPTEATLIAVEQVTSFVAAGALDSRCAAKIVKRLRKESEIVADAQSSTDPGRRAIKKAFDALDAGLRDCDAKLLVAAQAALREADAASKSRQ
ncbi:hypothetical protein [Paraburkholderia terrae]